MTGKTKEVHAQIMDRELHLAVWMTLRMIESLKELWYINKEEKAPELVVTSIYRPEDTGSYHSIWQAADIRTWNLDPLFVKFVKILSRFILKWIPKVQIVFEPTIWEIGHDGKKKPVRGEHFHIEYDNRDPRIVG